MTYVQYKGQSVSPMELKMLKEREKAEEKARKKKAEEKTKKEKAEREERKRKREELKTVRTGQMAPETKERLKRRLEKGPSEKAISGEKIPRYFKEEKSHVRPSPYKPLRLDFEPYPYPTTRPPTPKAVKRVQKGWMWYESIMGMPSKVLSERATKTLVKALEAKEFGRDIEAGLLISEYVLERAGAGIYEGFTIVPWFGIPLRPYALAESVATPIKIAKDPMLRGEFVEQVKADPLGFVAGVLGGFLGGYMAVKTMGFIKGKYVTYKMTPYEQRRAKLEAYLKRTSRGTVPRTEQILKPPEQIPQTEKPLSLPRWYYHPEIASFKSGTWEIAHTPSFRISKIAPTITKPFPSIYPGVYGVLGATRAFRVEKEKRVDEIAEEIIKESMEQVKIVKPAPRIKRRFREPIFPEYIAPPIEEPIQEQPTMPDVIPIPVVEPVVETITKGKVRQEPIPVPVSVKEGKPKPFPWFPMQISMVPRPMRIMPWEPKRKKGRYRGIGLDIFGEMRAYPIKDPMELIGGIGKKRRRAKKKKRRRKKR